MPPTLAVTFWITSIYAFIVIGVFMGVVTIVYMLKQRRSPQSSVAWLLGILICPWISVPLFMFMGGRKWRKLAERKGFLTVKERETEDVSDFGAQRIEQLIRSFGAAGASAGNRIELLGTGIEIYEEMIRGIDEAERSICIETFIFALDEVGLAIIDHLTRRAREGIEVRLLIDAIGDSTHPKKLRATKQRKKFASLLEAGGKLSYFMPMLHNPLRGSWNLRNHRKIAIFDDTVVISGGTNIADEYIGPTELPSRWKDCSMRIEGPGVQTYLDVFCHDWQFASGETYEPRPACKPRDDGQVVQIVPSGPDIDGDPIHDAFMSMTYLARKRIWIVTPFFVPDEAICTALASAARRGTDVQILVPQDSGMKMADWARETYVRECQEAGARVLRYMPGMVHAKLVLMDDELAVIGSANMDMRSLFLNYETAMMIYSETGIRDIERWITELAAKCECHELESDSHYGTVKEGIARMFGPLL